MIPFNRFLVLLAVFGSFSCTRPLPIKEETIKLYQNALDEIVTEYLSSGCALDADRVFIEKLNEDFDTRKIDRRRYDFVCDSLHTKRKKQLPKCVIEYGPLFLATKPAFKSDMQASMTSALQDEFFSQYFDNGRMSSVIDTLLRDASFDAKDITLSYVELVANDTTDRRNVFGRHGEGVIAFSRVNFNDEVDFAILYFEFRSSPNFQRGEIVFMEKTWSGDWKAVGFRNVWIT